MNSHQWAAAAIVCMVAVTIFMDWVATPFNRNIQGMTAAERLPSTIIHGTVGLAFAMANIVTLKWAVFAGAVWFSVVSVAAVVNWWIPYFAGAHWGEMNPEVYEEQYARNITVLPAFHGHPVIPDVQHMLIHITVVSSAILSWYSFGKA